jgi:hypothetical protein
MPILRGGRKSHPRRRRLSYLPVGVLACLGAASGSVAFGAVGAGAAADPGCVAAQASAVGEVSCSGPVKVSAGMIPESTGTLVRVTIWEV